MACVQLLEDEAHVAELAALPEHGMGYQYVEATINGEGPERYLVLDCQFMVKEDDYDTYLHKTRRYALQEQVVDAIRTGEIDQYYDEITDFDVSTTSPPRGRM